LQILQEAHKGGDFRIKEHLASIRGQVLPCDAPYEEIGQIRMEMLERFEKFEEEKARKKAMNVEIGRKRQLVVAMRASGSVEFEGSSFMPSTNVMDPFRYVPPPHEAELDRKPKKKNIKSYFPPSPNFVSGSQPTQIQPTLDSHWKKQYKASTFEYIARWWYDANIPFNVARSPYYQPMWNFVIVVGKALKALACMT
jgi:hypothetical protein